MTAPLSVIISADITDLQVKFAVAKAEVNGLTSEMNKLARASASGIIDPAGSARLQQVAGDLLAARQQTASYAGELQKAGFATNSFSTAMQAGHGSISTATREFRALFDELSSGRTRQTPGTLAIIAQRVIGLGPAALGAVAGVGALAGGLAYLGVQAIEASKGLLQAKLGAEFAGNFGISSESIKQLTTDLTSATNISNSEARQIAAALAAIPQITEPAFKALGAQVSDYARLTGQESPKAAEQLAKLFNPKTSASEFARSIDNVTQAQINMAEAAQRSGDAAKEMEAKLLIVESTLQRSAATLTKQQSLTSDNTLEFFKYTGAMSSGITLEEAQLDVKTRLNAESAKQVQLLKDVAAANLKQSSEQTLKVGVDVAEKDNPITKQIRDATTKANELKAALKLATDTNNVADLNAAIAKTNEELSNLQFGPVLERMREQIAQVAVTWEGTQSGMLAKQAQIAASMLANVQKDSKEELAIKTEVARLDVEQRRAAGAEIIADARAQAQALAADTSMGPIARLQAERQVWADIRAGDLANAQQRKEVAAQVATETVSIARETAAQNAAIARSDAETDIAIAKLGIEAKRDMLDLEVQENQISAARKLQILRDLSAQELALDLQNMQNELATMHQGTGEYERVLNEERELKAKQTLQLAQYDKQYAAEVARQQREQVTAWRMTVSEIENAEGQLINDVLGKRKNLGQSLVQIGQQFALKEIENDVKAFTTRILLQNTEAARKKASEQGGLLYHELTENQKIAATESSEAAQTSAEVAGDAARLASQTSAQAASKAVSASAGSAQVMADAAKAASGAYSAVAGILYVGPVLAPIAAGVAYAAVAGYESLASLDTGTNYVPRDMVAQIHKGEAVVPRQYNPAAGGGQVAKGGGKSASVNVSVTAMDSRGVEKALMRGGALQKQLRDLHRRAVR